MCGRFVLLTDLSTIVEYFQIDDAACDYQSGGNISPGQQVTTIVREKGRNRLVDCQWGLIPAWAKDPAIGNRMFNARAETVAEKPSFARAFQKRRCLIAADGFYEWQKIDKERRPFRFSLKSGRPFGFAGLYETWTAPDKTPVRTCTIITTEANELIRPIHDRMPVIVPRDREAFWIDPDNRLLPELLALLKPYPTSEMVHSAVDGALLRQPIH
jgi:putative SOS response-associated peptidase YedK